MKKILPIAVFIFILVGIVYLILNFQPLHEQNIQTLNKGPTDPEKEKIKDFWLHYREARRLRIAGERDSAINEYEAALELNSDHEDALYYLGSLYFQRQEYQKTFETWTKLETLAPRRARVNFRLGNFYLNPEAPEYLDIEKAEEEFSKTLKLNREDSEPLLHLGGVYLIKGELNRANTYFKDVLKSNFKSEAAYFLNGFIAWQQNDNALALHLFKEAVLLSKPKEKTKNQILGEGDTKSGKMLAKTTGHRYFDEYLDGLAAINDENLESSMVASYNKLDSLITQMQQLID